MQSNDTEKRGQESQGTQNPRGSHKADGRQLVTALGGRRGTEMSPSVTGVDPRKLLLIIRTETLKIGLLVTFHTLS